MILSNIFKLGDTVKCNNNYYSVLKCKNLTELKMIRRLIGVHHHDKQLIFVFYG